MDASGRSRVETHIVVGNINDKRESNFMITIQTNYKRGAGERAPRWGVPRQGEPKGFDFKSDQYDTHVEKGNANIGIEYGRGRAAPRAHPAHAGQGGLPNFYKDDWFGEEYQKTAVRPIRRKDALGMQWTGKETGYRKRETARQMHVDVIAAAEQP
eukprot:tig00000473_g1224.t1